MRKFGIVGEISGISIAGVAILAVLLNYPASGVAGAAQQSAGIPRTASSDAVTVRGLLLADELAHQHVIRVKRVVVSDDYALASWQDENAGGETLYHFDATTSAWQLAGGGGGTPSVRSLTDLYHVPQTTAAALVAKMAAP